MSDSKFKTFCRISDYLRKAYPEFHELLEGTCSIMNINTKGKPGLTVLVPQDKAYIKKISELAYSSSPDDARKACDMLNALILRDVFKTSADWNAKKANIPNSIYPSQHVEIVSAGKEVVFKSGAKAVLDEKFIDASKRNNLAVWILVSGEIPVTSDKPSKPPTRGKTTTGGCPSGSENSLAYRVIKNIEAEYLHTLQTPVQGRLRGSVSGMIVGGHYKETRLDQQLRDPFLEATLSLVQFAKAHDQSALYDWIIPHISFNKIDVYNILQPYCTENERMLHDDFVKSWCDYCARNEIDFQAAIDCVDKCLTEHRDGSLMYKDRIGVLQAVDERRVSLLTNFDKSKFALSGAFYGDVENGNVLGNLFPESLRTWYSAHPGLKQHEDEIRYISTALFCNALKQHDPSVRVQETKVVFDKIREYCEKHLLVLFNPNIINNMLLSSVDIEARIDFIKSTYYMFIPLSAKDMRNFPVKNARVKPKINSKTIWMINAEYEKLKERVPKATGGCDTDLVRELNGVTGSCPEDVKKAIIAAYNRIAALTGRETA